MPLSRSILTVLLQSLAGILLAASANCALAQELPAKPNAHCSNLSPDLMRAADEWKRPAQEGKVLDRPEGSAAITAGTKIRVTLFPSDKVTLAMSPRNPEVNVAGYSGLLSFTTGRAGPYRILLNQYLWLEMIDASGGSASVSVRAGALDSNRYLNRCAGMAKNLGFDLSANTRYWLQLSGGGMEVAEVAVSAPD